MIALSIPSGDLDLLDGDLNLIDSADYACQKIKSRLKFFLAEWFLDSREGFPWFRDVFGKGQNLEVIRSDIRRTILSVAGITAVRKLELSLDSIKRALSVDFECLYQQSAVPVTGSLTFIIGQG
jgi:hypothetical protein